MTLVYRVPAGWSPSAARLVRADWVIKLKSTSRIGKKQLERTGSTTVGDPLETPRSANDRKTDVDLTGPKPGDTVQILEGLGAGSRGQ